MDNFKVKVRYFLSSRIRLMKVCLQKVNMKMRMGFWNLKIILLWGDLRMVEKTVMDNWFNNKGLLKRRFLEARI